MRRVMTARGAVTALLSVGICLFAAPVAHADIEDLLDTDIGPASAEAPGAPGDPAALDASGVLQDPLAQLAQLFRSAPAESGSEPRPAAKPDEDDTPTYEQDDSSSDNSLKFPKVSLPSSGNGSGGNGGGSNGSGSHAGHGAKPKTNASATKPHVGIPEIDGHG